jgi:guanine deaminase
MMSRMLETGVDPARPAAERLGQAHARIDFREAFHLATAGGGEALGLPVGRFAPGYHFDAIAVDPAAEKGTIRLWDDDIGEDVLQAILYTASKPNIAKVWVGGVEVA